MAAKIRREDEVIVLTGKDKGKRGKVTKVLVEQGKVIVEGINLVTKHVKPTRMGQQGGIVKAEAPIYACKVMAVCPKCGKPTKPAHKIAQDGTKTRVCKKCGEAF